MVWSADATLVLVGLLLCDGAPPSGGVAAIQWVCWGRLTNGARQLRQVDRGKANWFHGELGCENQERSFLFSLLVLMPLGRFHLAGAGRQATL